MFWWVGGSFSTRVQILVSFAILEQRRLCACPFERNAHMSICNAGLISQNGAGWGGILDMATTCVGSRVRRSSSRSVRGDIVPAPAVSRVALYAVAHRDGVPSTAVQGGTMEIAVQVLTQSSMRAWSLIQDSAEYVQGQASLLMMLVIIVFGSRKDQHVLT